MLFRSVARLVIVDTEKALADVGSPRVLNLILLGAAMHSGALGFAEEEIIRAIRARIPAKFHDLNLKALAWAASEGKK